MKTEEEVNQNVALMFELLTNPRKFALVSSLVHAVDATGSTEQQLLILLDTEQKRALERMAVA